MKLPKLYSPVLIKFWSLRSRLAGNLGVIFDCDEEVERIAMRVLCECGWKWQLKNLAEWYDEQDQEVMDVYGMELEIEWIK